jgi:hypothetical protein
MAARDVIQVLESHSVVVRIKSKALRPLLPSLADVLVGRQPAKRLETFGEVVGRRGLLGGNAGTSGLR